MASNRSIIMVQVFHPTEEGIDEKPRIEVWRTVYEDDKYVGETSREYPKTARNLAATRGIIKKAQMVSEAEILCDGTVVSSWVID